MTTLTISDSSPRMGRPPLKVIPTMVRLDEGVAERIDAVMGAGYKRAQFIREAVLEKLVKLEREAEERK